MTDKTPSSEATDTGTDAEVTTEPTTPRPVVDLAADAETFRLLLWLAGFELHSSSVLGPCVSSKESGVSIRPKEEAFVLHYPSPQNKPGIPARAEISRTTPLHVVAEIARILHVAFS